MRRKLLSIINMTNKYIAYKVLLIIAVGSLFTLLSCDQDIGLGEGLDLTPPRLTIKYSDGVPVHSGNYSTTDFDLSGTCTDVGKGVQSVIVEQLAKDGNYYKIATAQIHGGVWTAQMRFSAGEGRSDSGFPDGKSTFDINREKEGTKILKVTATDKAGNSAAPSTKQILLFVDQTPPKGDAWYIDRLVSGFTYPLKDVEDLIEIQKEADDPANKDAFQNVAFSIYGTMSDKMGVKDVDIMLRELQFDENGNPKADESGNLVFRDVGRAGSNKLNVIEGGSFYNPQFDLTHDDLVALDPSLATGVHYLQVCYEASDVVTNPHANTNSDIIDTDEDGNITHPYADGWFPLGCFIWWPESDNPHVSLADRKSALVYNTDENGNKTTVKLDELGRETAIYSVKSTFMLNIFDDDEVDKVYSGLISDMEYGVLLKDAPNAAGNYLDWDKIKNNIANYSYTNDEDRGGTVAQNFLK